MNNSEPDLVRYACIAHHPPESIDSTILAEFNSADSSLQEIAHQCIHQVPPHHSIFTHSYRNQTYTFMLNDPFVYFGIFESNMSKQDQIRFLGRLKDTLGYLMKGSSNYKFTSYCLQGELHPIFHKLMSKSFDLDALHLIPSINSNNKPPPVSGSTKGRKILSVPIGKGYKKKRLCGESMTESKEALVDGKVDMLDDDDGVSHVKSREILCQNGLCLIDGGAGAIGGGVGNGGGRQKAKKIWRKHVWIVLVLDLSVCLILFGIWLFVCRGFQCIEG